jgi:hypothetical protein|tara:strand:- start:248 stop:475 length:228 start_codon:yes stop_codon:yes gene_type:complete
MLKNVFHNNKIFNKNLEKKELSQVIKINQKEVVDINKLLNRVKINSYNDKKQKIIFFSTLTLLFILVGIFISIIR